MKYALFLIILLLSLAILLSFARQEITEHFGGSETEKNGSNALFLILKSSILCFVLFCLSC